MKSENHQQADPNTPATRPAKPLSSDAKPDQLADKQRDAESRQEALIDEAVEETFPSSDPIAPKHIT
jgi:hypothetical protein